MFLVPNTASTQGAFFCDLLTVELCHASADCDLQVRTLALQFGPQSMVPYMRSAAFSRTAHVFMTMRSTS